MLDIEMVCPGCGAETYRYRMYFSGKEGITRRCYSCSSGEFPGLSTQKITIDAKDNLVMSPAEYHHVTHLVIGDGGVPFEDNSGKHIERTLIGKLNKRMPR